jgi:hypothetical protein
MSASSGIPAPSDGLWERTRSHLQRQEPAFFELEPGGALALSLGEDGWLLEITPDGRLICQYGMDMDDIKTLLSTGTPEDLGTDELAKQAKWYIQPEAAKFRQTLARAGFQENVEMTEEHVAVLFQRAVNLNDPDEVTKAIRWCREHIR